MSDKPTSLLTTVLNHKFGKEDAEAQTEQLKTVFLPDQAKLAHEINISTASTVSGLITTANNTAMTENQAELLNGLAVFLAESAKEISKRLMK